MNSAQPPEDGLWDATRGPHQQAGDPGREEGWGGVAVRMLFLNSAWFSLSPCAQGGKLGAPQIKLTLQMAISDPVVGTDKTLGSTKAADSSAPPHFLTDLEGTLRGVAP